MLPKKLVIILIAIVAAIVAAISLVGSWTFSLSKPNPAGPSRYSAVYLATGDIYFGKMDWFPWPHLKNVWLLQRNAGPGGQPQLGLTPFKNAFWGPVDEIYLNPKQIVFWARLRNDSQLTKAFENPSLLDQQQQPQQAPPPSPASGPPQENLQGPPTSTPPSSR